MKKKLLILISAILLNYNTMPNDAAQLEAQREAVDIVAAITNNLAALIINHKKESNPELTKHHSIELIKTITDIIARCIIHAKSKKQSLCPTKGFSINNEPYYDQETLNIVIQEIAHHLVQTIDNAQGNK